MATENYIRDLSEYLKSGILSDLTLKFADKSWNVHKALVCCHSKWFQKAVTGGYEETFSGVVTLNDDPEFVDAIECMVSYFYNAGYDITKYQTSESLLHAQVAVIADKYDCASLYKIARTSFANTVKNVESDDWAVIASFIYDHTAAEVPDHMELRDLVVTAITSGHSVLKSTLQNERIVELFRSNADLATDLLRGGLDAYGPKQNGASMHILFCDSCHYAHTGASNCAYVVCLNELDEKTCPQCGKEARTTFKRYAHRLDLFPCPFCDGIHTVSSP